MSSQEYCPHCHRVVQLTVAETRQRRVCPEGRTRKVLVRTFHCAVCRCFVRSEEVPLSAVQEEKDTTA